MVRVAGLHDQVDAGIDDRKADGLSPSETIELVAERGQELGRRHSRQWEAQIRPALAEHGIRVMDLDDCDERELEGVDRLFDEQIFPVLTPLAVGPGRPFPYISNLSLSIAVWLRDPVGGEELFARVKVPKEVLPRLLSIGDSVFVPLESVIARRLGDLFPGMEVVRHAFFRVTRDADFTVSDEADDLLRAVEDELRRRRFGEAVRLEVSQRHGSAHARVPDRAAGDRRGSGGGRGGAARPGGPLVAVRPRRPPRAARPALAAGAQARARRGRQGGHVRRHAGGRPPGAPPLPLVRGERGALRAAGGGGPRRARGEDDRVPDLGRLGPGAVADRGGRARQADRVPGGAEGALRRAPQHRLGARAGRGGRARGARPARPEDARQGAAGGPARGRRPAPLRAHRHRQLPRQDGAPLRGLRALHLRPGAHRRRGRALQRPHRRRALPPGTARRSWPRTT